MNKLFVNFLPPWVETNIQPAFYDKESGSVLQQTARMYAKVNCLVRMFNKLSKDTKETVDEYIAKFVELKDFVDTYFENLDVQEEINNKLDAMADSGELAEIISAYLNSLAIFGYDSVSDMLTSKNLGNGSYAKTTGYYSANDGGGATYKIRTKGENETPDEAFVITMQDSTLVAEMVIEDNTVNIRQIGAKSLEEDGTKHDIKTFIQKYLAYLDNSDNRIKLYIPSGFWHCSELEMDRLKGYEIFGDTTFPNISADGTIISSLEDNQDYIWKIGGTTNYCRNWSIKNICFTSDDATFSDGTFNWDFNPKSIGTALELVYALYGVSDNLFFMNIKGEALKITSSWENYFKLLNFRNINSKDSGVLVLNTADTTLNANANITACTFDKIMFESTLGDLILSKIRSKFTNCHIGVINFEDNQLSPYTGTYTPFSTNPEFDDNTAVHQCIINNKGSFGCNIDSIEINNMSRYLYEEDNVQYAYDAVVGATNDYNNIMSTISKILVNGMQKDSKMLYTTSTRPYLSSQLNIVSVVNGTNKKFVNKVAGYYKYSCKDINSGYGTTVNHNNMINFSDIITTPATEVDSRGYLYSDADSLNENKLVVKAFTDAAGDLNKRYIRTTVLNDNLAIRAKVENGETLILTISDSNNPSVYKQLSITGDGTYHVYNFENINDTLPIGTTIDIKPSGASANIGVDLYLDCLAFY